MGGRGVVRVGGCEARGAGAPGGVAVGAPAAHGAVAFEGGLGGPAARPEARGEGDVVAETAHCAWLLLLVLLLTSLLGRGGVSGLGDRVHVLLLLLLGVSSSNSEPVVHGAREVHSACFGLEPNLLAETHGWCLFVGCWL